MKHLKYILPLFFFLGTLSASINYTEYGKLLNTYVTAEGVDYEKWFEQKYDLKALEQVLESFAAVELEALSDAEKKAFYINLYNASMIQTVFENYPLESVGTLGSEPFSIFKKKFIPLGERTLSLDELEFDVLLEDHFDPRIHFAVNCAAASCPPLRAEPFIADKLDAQLDEQARNYANSELGVQIDEEGKRIAYSEIFNWYEDDFGMAHPAKFLNQYRDEKLPADYGLEWIDYDWNLNRVKR